MDTIGVQVGCFECEHGDRQRSAETIEDLDNLLVVNKVPMNLGLLGCDKFWEMTGPLEPYVTRCVSKTLSASGVHPDDVSHIVFSTSDGKLRDLDPDFAQRILISLSLVNCVPAILSMQQCASSLAGLDYASKLLQGGCAQNVLLVAFDYVATDHDRVQPYALCGDAVTSCMLSRHLAAPFRLASYSVGIDFKGLQGRDDHESRKTVAQTTLKKALAQAECQVEDLIACFSTNFYKPLATFNAGICGVVGDKLRNDTLATSAHCGNCDWMINLMAYDDGANALAAGPYLLQSFAPGFLACSVVEYQGLQRKHGDRDDDG